jgi:tetratricopeptide (TPR) repeat protein
MAKPGRNDPCHCGSGKKYKKCCQPKHEAAEHEELSKQQAKREERNVARRTELQRMKEQAVAELLGNAHDNAEEDDELTKASNAAVDLVQAGKFEEAEAAARDLIARYPEVHDGWDRLGMMYEAKGESKTAADCYRKALGIIRDRPQQYDPEFAAVFVELIDKLDPPAAGPVS